MCIRDRDNSLELVFMLLGGPNGANWVDGTSKTLTITDLILCPREPEDAEKTYLEGEWSLSLIHIFARGRGGGNVRRETSLGPEPSGETDSMCRLKFLKSNFFIYICFLG